MIEAKEHKINAAGFNNKKLVSKPFAYCSQIIVNKINATPEGMFPNKNGKLNAIKNIQSVS